MSITHAKVASDPQTPRLTDTDWNAAHSNPTLAEVLVAGADTGPTVILGGSVGVMDLAGVYQATRLQIFGNTPSGANGISASIGGGDGDSGFAGGTAGISGGGGGPSDGAGGGNASFNGATAPGDGGAVNIYGGDAEGGTDRLGGDIQLAPGAGDGAGRNGIVFLNLPTSDPGVSGALYSLAGVVKVSP